jgi:hypothetical protein
MSNINDRMVPWSLVSRRQFVTLATAFALGPRLHLPRLAGAQDTVMPKPIPGGITVPILNVSIHHYPPKPGGKLEEMDEPSQITDFDGLVTNCRIFGEGTGTDKAGNTARYPFMADMGFMTGSYIGEDGKQHNGTFGFI